MNCTSIPQNPLLKPITVSRKCWAFVAANFLMREHDNKTALPKMSLLQRKGWEDSFSWQMLFVFSKKYGRYKRKLVIRLAVSLSVNFSVAINSSTSIPEKVWGLPQPQSTTEIVTVTPGIFYTNFALQGLTFLIAIIAKQMLEAMEKLEIRLGPWSGLRLHTWK